MPNELPLPEELQHLIEKRADAGRRRENRRTNQEGELPTDQRGETDRRSVGRRAGGERFRPGDKPGFAGRYRCEVCLTCVVLDGSQGRLPGCAKCGNRSEPLYALIPE